MPRIYKLLEYDRAQMINQTLYQAIRRHEVCLIDWTWLRPNVFFEFGVRAACRADGAVHIASDLRAEKGQIANHLGVRWPQRPPSQSPAMVSLSLENPPDLTGLCHVKDMWALFDVKPYRVNDTSDIRSSCENITNCWRDTRELNSLGYQIIKAVGESATLEMRGAIASVVRLLEEERDLSLVRDQDVLSSTVLFAEQNPKVRGAALARSIGLDLCRRFLEVASTMDDSTSGLSSNLHEIQLRLRELARRPGFEEDYTLLAKVLAQLIRLQEPVS